MRLSDQANALCTTLAAASHAAERVAADVRERLELAELQLEVDLWILAGELFRQFLWTRTQRLFNIGIGYTWVGVMDVAWPPRRKEQLCPCGGSDLHVGELRRVDRIRHTAPAICYGCGQHWVYVSDLGTHAGSRTLVRRATEADVAELPGSSKHG